MLRIIGKAVRKVHIFRVYGFVYLFIQTKTGEIEMISKNRKHKRSSEVNQYELDALFSD